MGAIALIPQNYRAAASHNRSMVWITVVNSAPACLSGNHNTTLYFLK